MATPHLVTRRRRHGSLGSRVLIGVAALALPLGACSSSSDDATSRSQTSEQATKIGTKRAGCPDAQLPPETPLGNAQLRWTKGCVPFVRTPDDRFVDLPGFSYRPHYELVDGLRMAYVDVGPRDGQIILLLHGEPSWSYLYRKMIPPLTTAGYRVIALDMMGMGRSDKPVELDAYTYLEHVQWVGQFVDQLGIRNVTVFVQDWGSLIGLRVVGDHPDWFSRVVVANGQLPVVPPGLKLVSEPDPPTPDPSLVLPFDACQANGPTRKPLVPVLQECFGDWAWYAMVGTEFRASEVVDYLTTTTQTPAELAAYDAPYPDRIYMTGARTFPSLVNQLGEPPGNAAAREVFDQWTKPLLTLFGRLDPVLGTDAVQAQMRDTVPGATGQAHWAYPDANHFIQEDKGPDLARRVIAFIAANP